VLARHAAAAVLRPHGQQIALDRPDNANGRNMPEGRVERRGQASLPLFGGRKIDGLPNAVA
jgi:hypothetical protein